jgi:hypothetical protein
MSYQSQDHFTGNLFSEILPYGGKLNQENRWIKLSQLVPWSSLEEIYRKYFSPLGRPAKNSRLINGLLIAKHFRNLSDEEVVEEFLENPYLSRMLSGWLRSIGDKERNPSDDLV